MNRRGRPKIKRLETLEGRDEFFKAIAGFINKHLGKKRPFVMFICYEGEEGKTHSNMATNLTQKSRLEAWKGALVMMANATSKLIADYDFMRGGKIEDGLPFKPVEKEKSE